MVSVVKNRVRDATVDVAKGVGVVLVVLGHNIALSDTEAQRILSSFRMPLFLFMSGLFLKPGLDAYLRGRSRALLKPFFVVAVGTASLFWLKSALLADHDLPMLLSIAASKLAGVAYAVGTSLDNIPLWFLPALFLGQLCALGLIATGLLDRPATAVLLLVPVAWLGLWVMTAFAAPFDVDLGPVQLRRVIGLPWSLDLALVAGAFAAAGYSCRSLVIGFRPAAVPLVACGVAFAALHLGYDARLDLNTRLAVHIPVVVALAITGIYLALSAVWLLARTPWPAAALSACGRASLFILLFHALPQQETYWALQAGMGTGVVAGVVSFAVGLLVPFALLLVAHRIAFVGRLLLPARVPALSAR